MSRDKEYNGWSSYETWLVSLWMDNDEGSYNYWRAEAQDCYSHALACSSFTKEERATLNLSDQLKEELEEGIPGNVTGFYLDLLTAALSEVNWHEIARHRIEDVDKETEDEAA